MGLSAVIGGMSSGKDLVASHGVSESRVPF